MEDALSLRMTTNCEAAIRPKKQQKVVNTIVWTLQALSALAFLATATYKLSGAPMMVAEFELIGLGQWFRYFTGVLEILGAVALLVPRAAFYGAALLAMVIVGALIAHLAKLGIAAAAPAIILLVLNVAIACLRRPRA